MGASSAPTTEAEKLVRDVHPAEVSMPDGTVLTNARVFITTRRMLAYQAREAGRIEPVLEVDLAEPCTVPASRGTLQGQLEVRLNDGTTAWVNRGRGCGCGSPLKALGAPVSWTGN